MKNVFQKQKLFKSRVNLDCTQGWLLEKENIILKELEKGRMSFNRRIMIVKKVKLTIRNQCKTAEDNQASTHNDG